MPIKQSFFKLPIIFTLTYYVVAVLGAISGLVFTIMRKNDDYLWNILPMYISNISIQRLGSLFLSFVVVAIVCYRHKIHKVSARNVGMILITVLLTIVFQFALGYLWSTSVMSFLQYYALDMNWMMIVQPVFSLINLILVTIFIVFLFRLLKPMAERENSFEFNTNNFGSIYNVLFTASLMTIFIILSLYDVPSFMRYTYYSGGYSAIVFLGILLGLLINILFIYFSIRRCFTRVYETLQIARIFKSVGITFVILMGISILFGLVMVAFGMMSLNSRDWGVLIIFALVCILLGLVVNYVSLFLSSRFAIRQYFS